MTGLLVILTHWSVCIVGEMENETWDLQEVSALGTDKKHTCCHGKGIYSGGRLEKECFEGEVLVFVHTRAGTGILPRG